MTFEVSLWQLVSLLLAFFGAVASAGKILLSQIDRHLDARFVSLEAAKESASKNWNEKFAELLEHDREESRYMSELERQLYTLKADMPLQYVRREDYVRNQTVIEAKLDAVALKIENLQLKGPSR